MREINKLLKNSLENDLEQLQEKIDADPSQQSCELFDLNKKELEQIEHEEMNGKSFRSKIKWTEEGEKTQNTSFP